MNHELESTDVPWDALSGHAAAARALVTGGLDAVADFDNVEVLIAYAEALLESGWADAAAPAGGVYADLVTAIGRRPSVRALDARFSGPLWREAVDVYAASGVAGLRTLGIDDAMAHVIAIEALEESLLEA